VRVKHADATTQTIRLTPGEPTFEVSNAPSQLEVVATYFSLGVEHILLGIDHLLFVLALLFLVAFAFGLLHGFGFAGALSDVGLPGSAIPVALALFNVGVEVGQLCFIAVAFGVLRLAAIASGARADSFAVAARVATPACYAIGTLGVFWLIERTASF